MQSTSSVEQVFRNRNDPNVRIAEDGSKMRLIGRHGWQNQSKLDQMLVMSYQRHEGVQAAVLQTWQSNNPGKDPSDCVEDVKAHTNFFILNFVMPGIERDGLLEQIYTEF
eukprot:CAMPEP_0185010222 /NCGR_PEP_ID=MMETSP1098-20130426/94254_1 /TAXON_ID=89044 /ORGANISM="Spumella elongata, Strain CCAP 955/1" /LENGTH=109 /DNA_ID=CAMNT_0027539047 /DNA_START=8 /DNA_END=334 /DNA_ORIENTATION=+